MSAYNKSLPKVSDICWMSSDRKKRETTIVMPFEGVIPSSIPFIGWKQSSYTYSYQVQYMVNARLVPKKQLSTGSKSSKTAWKYPNSSWSGDVNTINKCIAPDKDNKYYKYYSFAGKSLMTKGSYDALAVTVRVRSFNKTKKQHGPWVTKDLQVKCKPTVKITKILALADGGIRIHLDTGGWMRGNSKVVLGNVRHESQIKENKKKLSCEVDAIGSKSLYADFPGKNFDADFRENEKIVLKDCYFETCDGVGVALDGTYTIDPASAVLDNPIVSIVKDADEASLEVELSKSDTADVWGDVESWLFYKDGTRLKRIDCAESWDCENEGKGFKFYPPLDRELILGIGIENNLGGKYKGTVTQLLKEELTDIASEGRIIVNYTDGTDEQPGNGMFNGSKIAVMNYETEVSTDASRTYETELPHGRKRPVAFLGEGLEMSISIKGTIDATQSDEYTTAKYSSHRHWKDFQEQQGIVLVRLPGGEFYQALCTKVAIDQSDEYDDCKEVTLSMEEVDLG